MKNTGLRIIRWLVDSYYKDYQLVDKMRIKSYQQDIHNLVKELTEMKTNKLFDKMKKK